MARHGTHVYVRGRGPGGCYRVNYPVATLRHWARHIRTWCREGKVVCVYFDNDQKSAAPADARLLAESKILNSASRQFR
jgi:uncharacterized protein YecE (DUF72 family)